MKTLIPPVKGTRDFYPEEMAIRSWLYNQVRQVSESFGYQEYEAPLLESIKLYEAKSGEELVNQQSFVFPDRGGDLITLRPELTPSLARMVAQRQGQLAFPIRWWSWGPFWRYERPQKGRGREFFQWNIDLIGADSPEADAELIAIAATFFKQAGLASNEVNILVNSRQLMNAQFEILDIPLEKRQEVLRWIDRRDKLGHSEWQAYALDIGLTKAQFEKLQECLSDQEIWRQSPDLVRLFPAVEALGVAEYVRFAPHIIRGLLYYTGTVFEAWDVAGEFRALFGGGRYDNLVSDVGGEPLPAVGFAMGDMVISLVLAKYGCLPQDSGRSPAPVLVTAFDEILLPASLGLAAELRRSGLNVTSYPEAAKLGKQFRWGDKMGMQVVVVLGPDELQSNQVTIKDLKRSEQVTVDRQAVAATIRKMLENGKPS